MLAIPAASASPEHLFSTSGNTMTKKWCSLSLSCNNLEECVYLQETWSQFGKWDADKKVLDMNQFILIGLGFFPWPLVSEEAFCYEVQVTFIWCGINVFSSTWNDCKRIWVGAHIVCLCVCRVRLPTWFVSESLTDNVDNQLWLVCFTTLQYPNFYHSVISIFDSRRQNVSIDCTIEN